MPKHVDQVPSDPPEPDVVAATTLEGQDEPVGSWVRIAREELTARLTGRDRFRRTVITTEAGLGKTTTMQWLRYAISVSTDPTLAVLIDVADLPDDPNQLLERNVVAELRKASENDEMSLKHEMAASLLRDFRKSGRLVLLIDGLDQVRRDNRRWMSTLRNVLASELWANCSIVLGSRPFALERDWSLLFADEWAEGWTFVRTEEFLPEQQRRYLGDGKYGQIPPEAREVLTIPRVLSYLRGSSDSELATIGTTSDVYLFATSRLLADGMHADEAQELHPDQILVLLSAIAFEMLCAGNFDGVRSNEFESFAQSVSSRCRTYRAEWNYDWTLSKLRRVIAMNEFLGYGILEAGSPREITWRNRSLHEFFAALWISKYRITASVEDETVMMYDPSNAQTGDYYWLWRFGSEMPEKAKNRLVWATSFARAFRPSENGGRRPTELIWRTWSAMEEYARNEEEAGRIAAQVLAGYRQEFVDIAAGLTGPKAKQISRQLLEGFRPIPPSIDSSPTELTVRIGSPPDESMRDADEDFVDVLVRVPFRMSQYPITLEQFALFDPGHTSWWARRKWRRRRPAQNLTWFDAMAFCRWMGQGYDLPTESEWEFACRAGTTTAYHGGDEASGHYVWASKYLYRTQLPVGCLEPNDWGLYDLHGHVWEWCANWYEDRLIGGMAGPTTAGLRALRGGAANAGSGNARSAARGLRHPGDPTGYTGFRVVHRD